MKTTAKHFAIFKKECEKWIEFFGLKGWEITIAHADDKENDDCLAYRKGFKSLTDRMITIGLPINVIGFKYTNNELKKSALHEVLEILFARYHHLAEARYPAPDDLEEEKHNLIRIFENTVFKKWGK